MFVEFGHPVFQQIIDILNGYVLWILTFHLVLYLYEAKCLSKDRENIISNDRQYILIEQHTIQVSLKESLNGDGQQFHQCQQNKQSPITTSTEH